MVNIVAEREDIFVSDSISDIVDMSQFYEDSDAESIFVKLNIDGFEANGKLKFFSLEKNEACHNLRFCFISSYNIAKSAMFSNKINSVIFYLKSSEVFLKSFEGLPITFMQIKSLDIINQCEYEFILSLEDI
tara:strand:+ start:217 stop:612 length:396 start_codon:yes stop_codon:yes gene_type:complete